MSDYSLVMSFWIDTDGYTDRDREMFVCGVEFQMVYHLVKQTGSFSGVVKQENMDRIRMMAAKLGKPCELKLLEHGWCECAVGCCLDKQEDNDE